MEMSGLIQNDTMERSYNGNHGRIVGRHAILDSKKYEKYKAMAERAAKAFKKDEKCKA